MIGQQQRTAENDGKPCALWEHSRERGNGVTRVSEAGEGAGEVWESQRSGRVIVERNGMNCLAIVYILHSKKRWGGLRPAAGARVDPGGGPIPSHWLGGRLGALAGRARTSPRARYCRQQGPTARPRGPSPPPFPPPRRLRSARRSPFPTVGVESGNCEVSGEVRVFVAWSGRGENWVMVGGDNTDEDQSKYPMHVLGEGWFRYPPFGLAPPSPPHPNVSRNSSQWCLGPLPTTNIGDGTQFPFPTFHDGKIFYLILGKFVSLFLSEGEKTRGVYWLLPDHHSFI